MNDLFTALLEELRDQSRPTRLVTGANAGTVVSVKVFVERNQVAPIGIGLKLFCGTEYWSPLVAIAQEDT